MAKEDRQVAEAVDKVLDKMIKRVETWWVTETAKEARKAEQAEARAAAKAAKAAEKAAAKAQVSRLSERRGMPMWGKGSKKAQISVQQKRHPNARRPRHVAGKL